MINTTRERPLAPEEYRVNEWRIAELVRHGYGPAQALLLALDPDVDLELARRLARRGCPPSLALRILT
jgi:hypothetical protein